MGKAREDVYDRLYPSSFQGSSERGLLRRRNDLIGVALEEEHPD
ncbi:MAG: hypothetical protein PSX37_14175 [bacterium]|nr:hypothetical protein [bacterium]